MKKQRKVSKENLWIEKLKWRVVLPKKVARYLAYQMEKTQPFRNFKIEYALYYLSLLGSVPARAKDKQYHYGFVPLHSQFLKKISYNYKKYFDYFMEIGILKKLNYNVNRSKSNRYKYNYQQIQMDGLETVDFTEFTFKKSLEKDADAKMKYAISTCEHLAQWFDHGLYLNYEWFLEDHDKKFTYNVFDDDSKIAEDILKAQNYYLNAYEFHRQNFRISRNPKSDNRLHSNLTNFPKELRKYVSYQGDTLKGLDIKNSQPYFMILLIEELIRKGNIEGYSNKRLERIWNSIYSNRITMMQVFNQVASSRAFKEEFLVIKKAVLEGQYYEFLGSVFQDIKPDYIDLDGNEIFTGKFYNPDSGYTDTLIFKSRRELMKKISMQLLYTPLSRPSKYYVIFKEKFPELCTLMELLKSATPSKESYKRFPRLLQHFEADCVLDYVTKGISEKYPDMPLFTIHDSIVTQWFWFNELQSSVSELMTEYSGGLPPVLDSQCWGIEPRYDVA